MRRCIERVNGVQVESLTNYGYAKKRENSVNHLGPPFITESVIFCNRKDSTIVVTGSSDLYLFKFDSTNRFIFLMRYKRYTRL